MMNEIYSYLGTITEESPHAPGYRQFNTGSPEVEVCEFLYGLVRMTKPDKVLETGTYKGISSLFIALAMQENERGELTTLELHTPPLAYAKELWDKFGVSPYIKPLIQSSLQYKTDNQFDMLFLDSEPDVRFDELVRFYDNLNPGGIVLIHDLHWNMGLSDVELHGMKNWPYGDFREKIGGWILTSELHVVNFRTPRGLTMLYKAHPDDGVYQYLNVNWVVDRRNKVSEDDEDQGDGEDEHIRSWVYTNKCQSGWVRHPRLGLGVRRVQTAVYGNCIDRRWRKILDI